MNILFKLVLLITYKLYGSQTLDPQTHTNEQHQQQHCNKTAYKTWYDSAYNNNVILRELYREFLLVSRADTRLWKVLDLEEVDEEQLYSFTLSKGQVIELTAVKCKDSLNQLTVNLAGMHGPVSDESIYDEMCNDFCTTNDKLRSEALEFSQCSCMELPFSSSSMPEDDPSLLNVTRTGGWCRENSGRVLCNSLERCGIWNCALDDFHCPRREYDTYYGSCSYASIFTPFLTTPWSIALSLLVNFYFIY